MLSFYDLLFLLTYLLGPDEMKINMCSFYMNLFGLIGFVGKVNTNNNLKGMTLSSITVTDTYISTILRRDCSLYRFAVDRDKKRQYAKVNSYFN